MPPFSWVHRALLSSSLSRAACYLTLFVRLRGSTPLIGSRAFFRVLLCMLNERLPVQASTSSLRSSILLRRWES